MRLTDKFSYISSNATRTRTLREERSLERIVYEKMRYQTPRDALVNDRSTLGAHGDNDNTDFGWLNQAEIEIGMFARQCLGKRRISDLKALRREARAWNRQMSRNRVKINWQFDRKAARRKFGYTTNSFKRSGN